MRGMIAAAVAWLRAAGMNNADLEKWLRGEIDARKMDFSARNAVQWFYKCTENRAPHGMIEAFKSFYPDPSQPLAEAQAKRHTIDILDTACLLNATA